MSSKNNTEERWHRLLEKIIRIEASGESLIFIGDLNKMVGNGEFGVKGNHEKVSFGENYYQMENIFSLTILKNVKEGPSLGLTQLIQQYYPAWTWS
jgi:hypothetical protein